MNYDLTKIRIKCAEICFPDWYDLNCVQENECWQDCSQAHAEMINRSPNYTKSADAALELVEWMNKKGAITTIELSGPICQVKLRTAETSQVFTEQAETPPLAVCLAFLRANGINPEKL